jgi:hypothetical protein
MPDNPALLSGGACWGPWWLLLRLAWSLVSRGARISRACASFCSMQAPCMLLLLLPMPGQLQDEQHTSDK